MTQSRRAVLAVGVTLLLLVPSVVTAQPEFVLMPTLGEQMARADYRFTVYPDQPVHSQPTDLGMVQHRVSFFTPLWQNATDELTFSASVRFEDFDTRAHMPGLSDRFPDELWDIRLTPTYRHRFDNGWIAGASITFGSASDEPFNSVHELTARGFAFLRVPHQERNAWIFSLSYSNYQETLGINTPIPGVAYLYSPSDRLTLVIGFPFSSIEWKPIDKLTFQASYLPAREVHARLTYQLFRPLRIYAGFDWDNEFHLRANRGDKDDRLFYYDKTVRLGIRFDLRHVGFEVVGGYTFDRFYFEGESYSDRRHGNRIEVDDGPFAVARISVRF